MNRLKTMRPSGTRTLARGRPPRPESRTPVTLTATDTVIDVSFRPRVSVVRRPARADANDRRKAALDYGLAALLTPACLLAVAVAALLIRLTSRGPALYAQTRLGRFGRPFTIYKLRTMKHNCEAEGGPKWSGRGDPRVTWLGAILRRLHVDELPQLINVWKGEMSLIGPRPERPEIVVALRPMIRGYDRRLAVLPGVSGFAQVHLPPDVTTDCVRRKLVFDRYYVRHSSLALDVKILGLTALKVLGLRRLYARVVRR
jgi:lipopolysaccharide/colanic/teichoic acid biosynthesis glycosyltransferase